MNATRFPGVKDMPAELVCGCRACLHHWERENLAILQRVLARDVFERAWAWWSQDRQIVYQITEQPPK